MFSKIMLVFKTLKKVYEYKKKADEIRAKLPQYIRGTCITLLLAVNSYLLYYTARKAVRSCKILKTMEEKA
ncbi:MAG: hypothetical protein IJ583_13685 [Firmicutes bacterium]|nr:hypothetical protein [Bacillota bacterium]